MSYADNHPFSAQYQGKVAEALAKPRYPNRAHPPAEGTHFQMSTKNSRKKTPEKLKK